MMKAVLSLLLCGGAMVSTVSGNAYSALKMAEAWKEPVTFDWEALDHAASWANWKAEFGKSYGDVEEEAYRFFAVYGELGNDQRAQSERPQLLARTQSVWRSERGGVSVRGARTRARLSARHESAQAQVRVRLDAEFGVDDWREPDGDRLDGRRRQIVCDAREESGTVRVVLGFFDDGLIGVALCD